MVAERGTEHVQIVSQENGPSGSGMQAGCLTTQLEPCVECLFQLHLHTGSAEKRQDKHTVLLWKSQEGALAAGADNKNSLGKLVMRHLAARQQLLTHDMG